MVTATSPGETALTPRFDSTPSLAPITKGVCSARPSLAATSAARPSMCQVVGTGRESCSARTPASSSAPSSQASRSMLNRPVAEAIEWSTCHWPNSRKNTYSLMPTKRSARANSSARSWRSHTSLASGDIGWIGVPVRR